MFGTLSVLNLYMYICIFILSLFYLKFILHLYVCVCESVCVHIYITCLLSLHYKMNILCKIFRKFSENRI